MSIINGQGRVGIRSGAAPSIPSIITSGLVLNLDAGNVASYPGTGTTWTDLSGNGNNATLYNGAVYNSANGGTMVFDGINDYASESNFIGALTTFTSGTWIKLNANQTTKAFISTYYNGWAVGISDYDQNKIKFYLGGATIYSTYALSINTWYYVCATYNNGNPTIYINGALNKTSTDLVSYGPINSTITIGALNGGNQFFNGNLSMQHIYNRALTASEITTNFNTTKTRFGL